MGRAVIGKTSCCQSCPGPVWAEGEDDANLRLVGNGQQAAGRLKCASEPTVVTDSRRDDIKCNGQALFCI